MNHNTASISRFLDSFEDEEDGSPSQSQFIQIHGLISSGLLLKSRNQFGTGVPFRRPGCEISVGIMKIM